MAETPTPSPFPADLLDLQRRLHQARHDFAALCAALPWSVEPDPGWPGTKHPHTDQVTGGRPESPGWTQEQREEHSRLLALVQELAIKVSCHPYWEKLPKDGSLVAARSKLKHDPDVLDLPAGDTAETAAA
ncbi:hypothetical protein [Streptomyces showdoensis]|uniref:Uncharacterized protein n=1 Tax=Streptomyces showdoensis TaxID=68268 RepID=A0A2P2GKS2_STREW|nr:hypothetical protein [Streptomyces showdoensis]KKZ72112.1 hypothetical protein VO63_20270 [Streptomyces showdoensis]